MLIRAELSPKARAGRARSPTVLPVLKHWAAWPRGIRWLAGIAAVVLALAFVWVLFVPIADWLARHDVGSATGPLHETAVDNARGRLLTLGAGLVAAAALVFTARNFNLLRRNSEQADQWQRRTHELTEQGQVTDRYTKAIEQLGSDKLDVRIGGIYALERIARDSPRDHPTVMEVLTAFIREHSREPWPPSDPGGQEQARSTRPDVQAAVTVVGRRDAERDILRINLAAADLTARTSSARTSPARTSTGANLADANLTAANLATRTSPTRTSPARTSPREPRRREPRRRAPRRRVPRRRVPSRRGPRRRGPQPRDLTGANLTGANLTGAGLTGANLARLADLTSAYLPGADLTRADLTGADLAGADLTGAKWPENAPVPEGWRLGTGTGRLMAADTGAESTEAT